MQATKLDILSQRVGEGHTLMATADELLWCSTCAAYGERRAQQSFRLPCSGMVAADGGSTRRRQLTRLAWLAAGCHPVSRCWLGEVLRWGSPLGLAEADGAGA